MSSPRVARKTPTFLKPQRTSKKMDLSASTQKKLVTFLSFPVTLSYSGIHFILQPVFLRGCSGLLHLLLLLSLLAIFLCNKLWMWDIDGAKHGFNKKKKEILCHKQTLVCCLGVSLFSFVLCILGYFYWFRNGWSDDKIATLLDLVLRTLSWGILSVYLQTQIFNSGGGKFPFLLRIWWGFYLSISCYCLVVDVVLYSMHVALHMQYLVIDVVSLLSGLFLCFVGFLSGVSQDSFAEEPLLAGESRVGSANEVEVDRSRGGDRVTPYANAGFFSILTISWMGSLIAFGNRKTLDLEDVPQLYSGDSVAGVFPAFKNELESSRGRAGGRVTAFKLVMALIVSTWKDILFTAFLAVVYTIASYVGPYLIDAFVQCLTGRGKFKDQGYFLASAFIVAKLVESLFQDQWYFKVRQIGVRIRAVLISVIYYKGLNLSCQTTHTSGEIINLMSVDVERIADFCWYIHDPWMLLLQVGLALFILYQSLGVAAIATLAATVVVMLFNFPLGRLQEKYQENLMKSKDRRMTATSEILRNMRILKLQAWEMKFLSKIFELRKVEEGWLKKYVYSSAIISFLFWGAPTFIAVATFGTCVALGIPLESGKILSALATFRILQGPIYKLPDTISTIIQTKVSLDRIASFLCLDDLQSDVVQRLPRGDSDAAIEIVDGTFSWDLSSQNATLKHINLKAFHGMKIAVCGTVGSGKSSLLSCILGEVPKVSGTVKLWGTKAYVAQSPWIQSGKIEENILFGKEMDREKYKMILEACSLLKDLEVLPFGDQTAIGERGINLSGGQKQRIQIARALYQDADIYLFDDPFSAVDAHTGSHLYKEVLLGLLNSKTVVYVTHQVEFLPTADLILVMKDGFITQAGKYNDILNSGSDFMQLVDAHKEALSALDSYQTALVSDNGNIGKGNVGMNDTDATVDIDENNDSLMSIIDEDAVPAAQLVQEEEREKGSVGLPIYWKYVTASYGGLLVPVILLAQIIFQALQIGSNYWMAWATPASKDMKPAVSVSTLMVIFVALSVGSSFCILARAVLLVTAGYKTATLYFDKMHFSIFRAPMSFFDATPSGRLLNRASTDQSAIETEIPNQVALVAFSIIQLLGIIAVMSMVAWQVFIVFIPVIAVSIWYEQFYIPAARELSRLVGVCKAPVIQLFAETLSGATTIRSFDQQSRFRETNMKVVDAYSRPKFHFAAAMEWLCVRLDLFSVFTFAFSLFFLVSFPEGIDPAIAGLAVTYGLNLNTLQAWVIWDICRCENKIISVERILQYMSIPSEPPLVIDDSRPDPSWPSHGEVAIENLQVRYAPHLPLVLRDVSCTFPGGMKTGIVGRTGSGKSTLIQALFRIVYPAAGKIVIDGIDISSIGLHDLRSKLSIIPQDPTMFEGTIRNNLDPLEEYADEQIWESLDKCQLGDEVRKKDKKLDATVTENGENWSMGQRQLVCLGRVLLKQSKVLVLDEATASVDTATDNLIQQTLRQHFSECTVITIAHRITSVLDSDMVLLLSRGLVEEFDSPSILLEDESSLFAQLVAEYTMRANSRSERLTDSK